MSLSRLELKVPPDIVALAVAGLMWLVSTVTPRVGLSLAWRGLAAGALGGAGVVLIVAARAAFARAGTTFSPVAPSRGSRLVTTGVYRRTRNPMYLGTFLVLLALGALLCSPGALVASLSFVAYIDRFQIRPEEHVLRVLFGAEYEAYTTTVRRWV